MSLEPAGRRRVGDTPVESAASEEPRAAGAWSSTVAPPAHETELPKVGYRRVPPGNVGAEAHPDRRRQRVPRGALIVAIVAGVIVALLPEILPRKHTSRATFVVEEGDSQDQLSGLALLASEFGVGKGLEPSKSPRFYIAALRSRTIMDSVLGTTFRTEDGRARRLQEILVKDWDGSRLARARAIRRLGGMTSISLDAQTSIIAIEVRSRNRELAADVTTTYVTHLDRFNREYRQTQGRRRRAFLEGRVNEARAELRAAEEAQRIFLVRNRDYQMSPTLNLEYQRRSRDVMAKQDLHSSLIKQYETARIEEVDDQSTISYLDRAEPAADPTPLRRLASALVLFLVTAATLLGVIIADWLFDVRGSIRRWWRQLAGVS